MDNKSPVVLLVGVDGEIGSYLLNDLPEYGFKVRGTSRKNLHPSDSVICGYDLGNQAFPLDTEGVTVAVICASMNPMECDSEPELARKVNANATLRLAHTLIEQGIFVLFLSSNLVFDGSKPFSKVEDKVNPRNLYGELKVEVENELLRLGGSAFLRLTKVLSPNSPLIKLWRGEEEVKRKAVAFDDVLVSPVDLSSVSGAIREILLSRIPGAFHLGGTRELSFAELANEYFQNEPVVLSKISIQPNGGLFDSHIHNSLTTRLPPKETQYAALHAKQRFQMGLMSGHAYLEDPKRLAFTLSRYKFVSKILAGSTKTLEIGCADGFGSPLVAREVGQLVATDFDESFVSDARQTHPYSSEIEFRAHDILAGPIDQGFDSAYALDVLEHIPIEAEELFVRNICDSLITSSRCIFGMPSAESQIHASPISVEGHVNCKTAPNLKIFLEKFFRHVFIFSMNDEVVHTGFTPMAQYLLAVACEKKD